MRRLLVTTLLGLFALAPAAAIQAQEVHAVTGAEMDAMVSERTAALDADREAIHALLRHPEVRSVARTAGLDMHRAESAVEVLEAEEVERLAPKARQLYGALTGGQSTIVISSTVLIIALLVLIIILVAD